MQHCHRIRIWCQTTKVHSYYMYNDHKQHGFIVGTWEIKQSTQSTLSHRDGRFGSKVGQIGPKWDKSGAFSDQISVHLALLRQMH